MKICIIGCGAIGSLFAAHLARLPDTEVYAYDVAAAHMAAIAANGLRVSGASEFTTHPRAVSDAAQLPRCDFGILATKSTHTRSAIQQTAHAFDAASAVCSVQNGAGNEEIAAEFVRQVIRGTTFPAGHLIGPGRVSYDIQGKTWIGPFEPAPAPMAAVEQLADALNRSGMETLALADARGAQWTKLAFNAATNAVGALTQLHHGAATNFAPTRALFDALLDECLAVARAQGITLHDDPRALIEYAARAPGKHKASMLQDILARRSTEVDFLNGAIVRWGEKSGVPTPLNRTVWALIKGLEYGWTDP